MRRARLWIGAAVFLGALALGFSLSRPLAPSRLRQDLEQRLAGLLDGQVHIGRLRVSLGLGLDLHLDGEDIEVWPSAGGPALRVEHASADLRLYSQLTGQQLLSHLKLQGAHLRVVRSRQGHWSPPFAAELLDVHESGEPENPDELLQPLVALEIGTRFALTKLLVADDIEVRDGSIEVVQAPTSPQRRRRLTLASIQGRLQRRLWLGGTRLALHTRLEDAAGERGSFECEGTRSRSDELRLTLATTSLDLSALTPYLAEGRPAQSLGGRLSGTVSFEAPTPGQAHVEVDLVTHHLRSSVPASEERPLLPLRTRRAELRAELAISPQQVRLENARFSTDLVDLKLDGTLERPVHGGSLGELALELRDITVADVRHLIAWLPGVDRREAEAVMRTVEQGRLELLRLGGATTLSGWRSFLAGRSRELPDHFVLDAKLAGATVRVGESDHIEKLSGRLWWTGDRLEVQGARAALNGSPLPQLDLELEGLSHLFASDPRARALASGAAPLAGLRPLWQALSGGKSGEARTDVGTVRLEIDRLEHPMFFWPIANAVALIHPLDDGVRVETSGGTWAGVPVSGSVDWLFEPSERVRASFRAWPAQEPAPPAAHGRSWASGRFEVGRIDGGAWRQASARGRFDARGGTVEVQDADIALLPAGRARASASLDLSRPDSVPFQWSFSVKDGDVATLGRIVDLPPDFASGSVDAAGTLEGALGGPTPLAANLSGLIDLDARDGTIRQGIPAVAAVALASEMFNPFARRELVHYSKIKTLLELDGGKLHSNGLALDGPDVRAFASGSIDVAREPHPVDVAVALFLFRPVGSVIEKIPLVNLLLLGRDDSLMAAHIQLEGPWSDPHGRIVPLRTLASGPLVDGLPTLVQRGLQAIGSLFGVGPVAGHAPPPRRVPSES